MHGDDEGTRSGVSTIPVRYYHASLGDDWGVGGTEGMWMMSMSGVVYVP
jgi:hypothetical protein